MSGRGERPAQGAGTWTVMSVSLRRMVLAKRTVLLALLALVPAGLGLLSVLAALSSSGERLVPATLLAAQSELFLRLVLPLGAILYGGAVIADEVDAGTFVYLWARPVRRLPLVAGRTASAALCAWAVTSLGVLALTGTALLVGLRAEHLARVPQALAALALAAPAYTALFAAFGSWFKRPLIAGILWALLWEGIVGMLPGGIRHLTISQHTRSLFPWVQEDTGWFAAAFEPTPAWVAVLVLALFAAVMVSAHAVWLRHYELRLQSGED